MRISINENLSGTLNFFGKTEFNMIFWAEGNQGNGKGLKFVLVCESLGWPNVHHSRSNTNLVEVPERMQSESAVTFIRIRTVTCSNSLFHRKCVPAPQI